MIDRVVASTFDATAGSPYKAEIKRSIQEVVVDRLIDIAETAPMSQVRAIAAQKLKAIQARAARPGTNPADAASLQLVAMDIKRFFDRPGEPADVRRCPVHLQAPRSATAG